MQRKFNHFYPKNFVFYSFSASKVFIAIILYVLVGVQNLAAQQKQEDVVYLKNGSVLHGTILENKPGETIKIQTHDRNIWVFTAAEIDKITREDMPGEAQRLSKAKGYYNATTGGLMFGELGLKSTIANGHKWSPYFSTGVLLSFDLYEGEDLFAVMGVDLRGELIRKTVTPYWVLQAGYPVIAPASDPWRKITPGIMYQPGCGIMFMVGKNIALLTELGYKVQFVKTETLFGQNRTVVEREMRSINFNIGLQF